MDDDFVKLVTQIRAERIRDKAAENPPHLMAAKTDFIFYYRINDKPFAPATFKEWLIAEKPPLNWWQKMWLMKNLFGIEFEYDSDAKNWVCKKAAYLLDNDLIV